MVLSTVKLGLQDEAITLLPRKTKRVTTSSRVVLRTAPLGRLGSYQICEHLAWPANSFIPPASRLVESYPTS